MLSEGDSLHWNISGEENRTGVVNTLLQREVSLCVRFLPPSLLSQICTDIISISVSYLFPVNLDESLSVVIAF